MKNIILFILFTACNWLFVYTQTNLLKNPSVESDLTGAFAPEGWISCHSWSDPDIHPDRYGVAAIEGNRLALMRTRGATFYDPDRVRTAEYMLNELNSLLKKDYCYNFSVYLCNVNFEGINDLVDPKTYPLMFELRGTNDSCPEDMADIEQYELLARTKTRIENTTFLNYSLGFHVKDTSYRFLLIRPIWDLEFKSAPYNGIVLVDNMFLQEIRPVQLPVDTVAYYKKIPPLYLTATSGISWEWTPEINLNQYDIQSPYMTGFDEKYNLYSVITRDVMGCPTYQNFKIFYVCDTIYPKNDYFRSVEIYYRINPPIQIIAGSGVSHLWSDGGQGKLSNDTIQKPYIDEYGPRFEVEINDDSPYRCLYREEFFIKIDCDTIYPFEDTLVLDTKIQYGEGVVLEPKTGNIFNNWQPIEGLDFSGTFPIAYPKYNTLYSVDVTWMYGTLECTHKEFFKIDLDYKIPNVITPGDGFGLNDVFRIPGLPPGSSIKIFDKNGRLVFEANPYDYTNWWDGKDMNGNDVKSGNYWYGLEIPGENKPVTNFVFVVR